MMKNNNRQREMENNQYIICDRRLATFFPPGFRHLQNDGNARIIYFNRANVYLVYPSLRTITDGEDLGQILYGFSTLVESGRDRGNYGRLSDDDRAIVDRALANLNNNVPTWDEYLRRAAGIRDNPAQTNRDWLDDMRDRRRRHFGF